MKIRDAVIWNLIEVAISSILLFVIYRVVIAKLGLHALGVWALVLSVTSVARVADLGASGGLARYVARAGDDAVAASLSLTYIRAAFALNAFLYIALALLSYWPVWWILGIIAPSSSLNDARVLLPYSIVAFALLNVSSVASAALTGLGLGAEKSKLMIGTSLVQSGIVYLTAHRAGLAGVAVGQIVQYVLVGAIGWLIIRNKMFKLGMKSVPRAPFAAQRDVIREIINFGAKLQVLNIVAMLFDPLVKGSISAASGMTNLALYELASRTVLQLRQLVISPSQNLVPLYSRSLNFPHPEFSDVYRRTSSIVWLTAAILAILLLLISPVLSLIWLGHMNNQFLLYSAVLTVCWFVNIAAAPAYMLGIAGGDLKSNILASAVMSFLTPALIYASIFAAMENQMIFMVGFGIIGGGLIMLIGNTVRYDVQTWPSCMGILDAMNNLLGHLRPFIRRWKGLKEGKAD